MLALAESGQTGEVRRVEDEVVISVQGKSDAAMNKISKVKVLPRYRLEVEFEDGVSGTVDLSENVGKGVFALWRDPLFFKSQRRANHEI